MIGTESIDRVTGRDVYDPSGERIGAASEVYLDNDTDQPEWLTVRTGLFGTRESFVPIRDAALTGDGIRVSVSKSTVKDAPRIDAKGYLSRQEELDLYRYYGMDLGEAAGPAPTSGVAGDEALTDEALTDDAITRSEERLVTGTRAEEVGRVRLRKYVVTENVTETGPVSHEEVRVRREPVTDADAPDGHAFVEEEREVTLHAERPVVAKEAVPVERVSLDTETVTEEEQVSADLRREEIEVEGPATTDGRL
ncbi:DUF2382 domain-containing protein [Geodermatophilus sp. SYSU D01036]